MALANRDGVAETSIPGLAVAAQVTLEQTQDAINRLSSPDPFSRTKEHEGRKLREVDGGYELINHGKYHDLMSAEDQRAKAAERQRKHRARKASRDVTRDVPLVTTPDQTRPNQTKEKREPSPTPRRWRRVPDTWQPSPAHLELAKQLGVNAAQQEALFRDHEFATPKTDPDATFRTWLRRASSFASGAPAGGGKPPGLVQHEANRKRPARLPWVSQPPGMVRE